jgi:T5SS/PEP-CTERM-associated repeat protein
LLNVRRICIVAAGTILAVVSCPRAALSTISFSGDTSIGSQFIIGNTSFGTFRIDGGSTYTTSSNTVSLGYQPSGFGIATVTGSGSQWTLTNSSSIDVGASGVGRLEVLNGGVLTWVTSFNGIDIASGSTGSQGTVIVDGAGSLINTGGINIGYPFGSSGGAAVLQITGGASVFSSQTAISTLGRLELGNGFFRTGQFTSNNGVIVGSGEVNIPSTSPFTIGGRIESSGGLLRFSGPSGTMQNNGVIAAEGAPLEFNRAITNSTNGANAAEITLRSGTVRAGLLTSSGPQLTNSAVLAAIGGTNDFFGRITNTTTGSIAVTNNSVMIFHDDVTADGGTITVFPGSTAVFLEDLTMNPGSTLLANIAGTNQNTGFGVVEVVGVAQVAGSVQATLASGFTPQAGDSFPLVAASSISGTLALGNMPSLAAGLKWDLDVDTNRVILNVVPGLAGDYNGNGTVDSADYALWRKTVDQTGPNLPADGNSDGKVDGADYDFWRSRLGNSIGSSLGSALAVPEPNTTILFFAATTLVLCGWRKLHLR